LKAPIADLSFLSDSKEHSLMILLSNNSILILLCEKLEMHPWSIENDNLKRKSIPHDLRFSLNGFAMDPKSSSNFFVYGQLHSMFVDLTEDIPGTPKVISPSYAQAAALQLAEKRVSFAIETKGNKRKRDNDDTDVEDEVVDENRQITSVTKDEPSSSSNFALIETYRNILHMGMTANRQLVSIFP
jgi:hypothetical protein